MFIDSKRPSRVPWKCYLLILHFISRVWYHMQRPSSCKHARSSCIVSSPSYPCRRDPKANRQRSINKRKGSSVRSIKRVPIVIEISQRTILSPLASRCVGVPAQIGGRWSWRALAALPRTHLIAVLLQHIAHGKLWVLLQDVHHSFVTLALFLLLASNALLATLSLPLFDLLDLAPRKEQWSAYFDFEGRLEKSTSAHSSPSTLRMHP